MSEKEMKGMLRHKLLKGFESSSSEDEVSVLNRLLVCCCPCEWVNALFILSDVAEWEIFLWEFQDFVE